MATDDKGAKAGFTTRCIHSGLGEDAMDGSIAQPIYPSTIYELKPTKGRKSAKYAYARAANPNRTALETALADLDGGAAALAFASGSAAITALLLALPHASDILLPEDYYMGTRRILWDMFAERMRWKSVDMRDPDKVRRAIVPGTKLVWAETPSNPHLHIVDLRAIAGIAHDKGAALAVDATWPTPVLLRPIEHGADVVVHSASKYMGGHSDVTMGALVFAEEGELFDTCRTNQWLGGGVPSPQDCWMVRRGLMTLPLRMRAHCANAFAVAKWLAKRPEVSAVHYPGLAKGKALEIAKRQMPDGFGGMVSFQLKAGEKAARRLPRETKLAKNATSLGGVESLIEWRRGSEGIDSPTPADLVRFSVGIEDIGDILADLEQALAKACADG